jgi:molecular chaperone HscB
MRRVVHGVGVAGENHFSLFGLPEQFSQDSDALERTWRVLAAKVHPDRYVTATPAEKRLAMQWASTVNEAYRVLKSPLDRARYLCELAGHDVQAESNTRMDGAFLMLQMEWRERLDEAREAGDAGLLDELENEIEQARADMQAAVATLIDGRDDRAAAGAKVREWMFIEKMSREVQAARHVLTDRQN